MTAFSQAQDVNKAALIAIDAEKPGPVISGHIYGHFSEHLGRCIYDGIWVGPDSEIENDNGYRTAVLEGLREINIPNLRWPGGCFADQYHWKEGVGPVEDRPEMINMHWGMVVEDNSFGTHEFLNYCEMVDTEPYLAGNVGSGTVEELTDWVEYCNRDSGGDMATWRKENGRAEPWAVKYWGVGNENWGCGGHMSPEVYVDKYRQFATYVMDYGTDPYRIACGANAEDYRWTEVVMENATRPGWLMQGISLHYYTFTGTWRDKGDAIDFTEADYMELLHRVQRMDEIVTRHSQIMDRFDPQKRVGLMVDEWGNWWNVEEGTNPRFLYQQNTMRDAITAGMTLNIFNSHADRVQMANIAQTVNVLQALFLTEGEKTIKTPTYHIFDLYQVHFDANLLPTKVMSPDYQHGERVFPAVNVSASKSENGRINLTICHTNPNESLEISCDLGGAEVSSVQGRLLTADKLNAHNTFDDPEVVTTRPVENARIEDGMLRLTVPPMSVTALTLN